MRTLTGFHNSDEIFFEKVDFPLKLPSPTDYQAEPDTTNQLPTENELRVFIPRFIELNNA
jgi:hypothetical protein